MKAHEATRRNHLNQGPHRSMAAQHEKTRLEDPEDISGDGPPPTIESIRKNHTNSGGHSAGTSGKFGMAAKHHITVQPDTHELETDIMETGGKGSY